MTIQHYSIKEALNRIYRLLRGDPFVNDYPDTVSGDLYSHDEALSRIAELLGNSLPGETARLPSTVIVSTASIPTGSYSSPSHTHTSLSSLSTLQVGTSPNYAYIEADGTFRVTGSATAFEDLRVDGLSARPGVVAPTDETGFRGNSSFQARNFVDNQADEIQFDVQMPHSWNAGSPIYPHVHFSPWITGTASVQAARFVLDYYWADVNGTFPTGSSTYQMTYTWTGSFQWKHLIATNASPLSSTGKSLSSILKCRLYRDNTVASNLGGKITFLYFDIHYEVDSLGSSQEYTK